MPGNSGGSGVILSSSESMSYILTNSHVCQVIKNGGKVTAPGGTYTVTAYLPSAIHDLCLVYVSGNLHASAKLAQQAPDLYNGEASISGHPELLPNVITKGHYSGRMVIDVLMGMRPCSEKEAQADPLTCIFFGGYPIIKTYESNLVTATIMAGSSGSGVFNSKGELTNLAFAGSGDLSYAYVVPYEYLVNFLGREVYESVPFLPGEEAALEQDANETISEACATAIPGTTKSGTIKRACKLADQSLIWRADASIKR